MLQRFVGILAVAAGALSSGCLVVEEDHHHGYSNDGYTDPDVAPPPSSAPAIEPMLVVIDTDKTMTADPGQGVGVFVEYGAGGAWTVFWTCDTAISGRRCPVSLKLATEGGFDDVATQGLPGASVMLSSQELSVTTTTGSELHGLTFHSAPGDVLTLDARVGGLDDGSFLFFVQNGEVNGGFAGTLTNPIRFQGTTP